MSISNSSSAAAAHYWVMVPLPFAERSRAEVDQIIGNAWRSLARRAISAALPFKCRPKMFTRSMMPWSTAVVEAEARLQRESAMQGSRAGPHACGGTEQSEAW